MNINKYIKKIILLNIINLYGYVLGVNDIYDICDMFIGKN